MTPAKLTTRQVASCYGLSLSYVCRLTVLLGLTAEDWESPDVVFERLLTKSASPLRRKLSLGTHRAVVKKRIATLLRKSQTPSLT